MMSKQKLGLKKNKNVEPVVHSEKKLPEGNTSPLPVAERINRKKAKVQDSIRILKETYPALFNPKELLPLAVGIHSQIFADKANGKISIPSNGLRQGLKYWTSSARYLEQVAKGGPRYNLSGSPEGVIEERQIEEAKRRLEQIKSKSKSKKSKATTGTAKSGE
ncbi:ProQ/FINO family protein [Pseudomonas luteola]